MSTKFLYLNLSSFLEENLDEYKELTQPSKDLFCRLLWVTQIHDSDPNALAITYTFIKDCLGSTMNSFHRLNKQFELFESDRTYKNKDAVKWYPNPIINEILYQFLLSDYNGDMKLIKDKKELCFTNPPKTMKCAKISIPYTVKIDRRATFDFMSATTNPLYQGLCIRYLALSNNNSTSLGDIPQLYSKIKYTRYQGVGVSLQNCPKELRTALLNGQYDYDIENCHPTILAQQEGDYPTLDHYINNTQEVRNELSAQYNLEIADVKQALLALFYGASTSYAFSSIATIITDKEKGEEFLSNPYINKMIKEARAAGKILISKLSFIKEDKKNPGKYKAGSKEPRSLTSAMSIAVQHIESTLLEVIAENYPIHVLIHDGFCSTTGLDISEIETTILKETGYIVKLTKDQLIYEGE